MKKEFEEIPHSGGRVIFYNGLSRYENRNPFPATLYEIIVSFEGKILGRGNFRGAKLNIPSISVIMGSDREGYFGYTCPDCKKYFRGSDVPIFMACPYCLHIDNALSYLTENQKQYIALYHKMSLEHYRTGKNLEISLDEIVNTLENNLIKLTNSEIRQQQGIECKNCRIKLDVLGLYAGCTYCGKRNNFDVFLSGLSEIKEQINSSKISTNEALVRTVEAYTGAGSDIKFLLEKIQYLSQLEAKDVNKIDFQKIIETNEILASIKLNLFPDVGETKEFLSLMFQRRHIIAHKSGIVDQKYLDKTQDSSVRLGQKISIRRDELFRFFDLIENCARDFFNDFNLILLEYIKEIREVN